MILLRIFGYAVLAVIVTCFVLGWLCHVAFARGVKLRKEMARQGVEPCARDGIPAPRPGARGDVTPSAFPASLCASPSAPPAANGPRQERTTEEIRQSMSAAIAGYVRETDRQFN